MVSSKADKPFQSHGGSADVSLLSLMEARSLYFQRASRRSEGCSTVIAQPDRWSKHKNVELDGDFGDGRSML